MTSIRWRPIVLTAAISLVVLAPIPAQVASSAGPYVAPSCTLAKPSTNKPAGCTWHGVALQSPGSESAIATPDLATACHPDTTAECEDARVVVPAGVSPSSLYVKVAWQHPVWSAYMYVIDPNGDLKGQGGIGCDTSSFEKGCGNQTALPFDELVVADPMPGTWTVRVAAVSMHDETYTGTVALTNSHPLEYAREALAQLTSHLTRWTPVNLVFAGWKPTAGELSDMQQSLTGELMPSVSEKEFCDGADSRDTGVSGLVQHETSHCTATETPGATNYSESGAVPYFEPLRYLFQYHFLAADDTWTRDLFSVMKQATTQDHTLGSSRIPETTETAPFKSAYLAAYNAQYGNADRGSNQVTDTSKVDEVDGPKVESWIEAHRLDAKYNRSFTDLVTGKRRSAAFIDPDPNATRDPLWNGNGAHAVDVDTNPQSVNNGVTFFLLDTFTPSYANDYFRADHYHYWWTANHVKDPDTKSPSFIDNGRGWGGRYRFHILDLGSAPSTYERANWVSAAIAPDGGSAAFDPPIWDYRNDSQWNGSSPATHLQAGGNTLGKVMGWEVTQGLAFKYVGGYLYRPIPNDVYILATSDVVDHYSLPSEGDLYSVDMTKVAQNKVALRALSSAAPYDTFLPGPSQTRVLGCAANRAVIIGNPSQVGVLTQGLVSQVPDPKCDGSTPLETPDGLQQSIEDGKANGAGELFDGATVPDFAVDQHLIRDYIDHHRAQYAPLHAGAFTVPVVNIMFEHAYNVALPLIVGGIAENVNGGEGWGQFDNVNDSLVPAAAIDCSQSSAVAPGCNGIPDTFRHDYGLTYTMEHEAAHFLGVNHPHDGAVTVERAADGQWHYYYEMLKWLYDASASPTTYAGTYGTYEIVDQERLMAGHAAEYLKQMQDWLSDSYFRDGAAGRTTPSAATNGRVKRALAYRDSASKLFQRGDYLHAMYAMRNAGLRAKGIGTAPVAPHRMTLAQAAHDTDAVFTINPQHNYGPAAPATPFPPVWFAGISSPSRNVSNASALQPLLSYCHIHWQ